MLALVLFIASVLTALMTTSLLRRYRQAVQALTRKRVTDDPTPTPPPTPSPAWLSADEASALQGPPARPLAPAVESGPAPRLSPAAASILRRARWGPWLSALVYGIAGLVYAARVTLTWSANSEVFGAFPLAVRIAVFVL